MSSILKCKFCGKPLHHTFADLGVQPFCESYLEADKLNQMEPFYPLRVYFCNDCLLVQLEESMTPKKLFTNYAYFSSHSIGWMKHIESYSEMITAKLGLNNKSQVIEIGSNDGYLLQYFAQHHIPVLGIEPAANVAKVAVEKGVPTLVRFFGTQVAKELVSKRGGADLVLGNNVLAQVPDLNDFVEGLKILLKPEGVLTLEFPHLLRLMEWNEFDTIYHEHFSYFSLLTTVRVLEAHGMKVFDVEELSTHGGSLRVYGRRIESTTHTVQPSVARLIETERQAGLACPGGYERFAQQVKETKFAFVEFLLSAAREGKKVAGYGAPGKSATLLHYCGIGRDLIEFTVDRSPHKQGRFLPGSHIPIYRPDRIRETQPDYVVILPWNLKTEIMEQLSFIREWGGKFVVPIPKVTVC